MITRTITIGLLVLLLNSYFSVSRAQEIELPYKNLTLLGNLEIAPNHAIADGVILMTHAGLGHRAMETMVTVQGLLREQGINSLAITLSLGKDRRQGMLDCKSTHRHLFADAVNEIGAWVDWLIKNKAKQVILLGHSRGGSQTAYYAAEHDQSEIKAIILLATDTLDTNSAQVYQRRYKKSLSQVLSRVASLLKAGHGASIMQHTDFLYCGDTSVTAATFNSYYGDDPHLDSGLTIAKITKPTLIILAGMDSIVINNNKFRALATQRNIYVEEVEAADHFFRDLNADEAVDKIVRFLHSLNMR